MRKVFLDLGAHVGESVRYFRKHWPDWKEYEYFAFEPLPENIEKLNLIEGITVIEAAAAHYNSSTNFYTGLSESGSLSDKKRTGGLDGETHIIVRTIDFPAWFDKTILMGCDQNYIPEVIIKMNIEGSEYDIIERMFYDGLLPYVSKFYIQWHWQKIGLSKAEHDRISGLIKWLPWEVM